MRRILTLAFSLVVPSLTLAQGSWEPDQLYVQEAIRNVTTYEITTSYVMPPMAFGGQAGPAHLSLRVNGVLEANFCTQEAGKLVLVATPGESAIAGEKLIKLSLGYLVSGLNPNGFCQSSSSPRTFSAAIALPAAEEGISSYRMEWDVKASGFQLPADAPKGPAVWVVSRATNTQWSTTSKPTDLRSPSLAGFPPIVFNVSHFTVARVGIEKATAVEVIAEHIHSQLRYAEAELHVTLDAARPKCTDPLTARVMGAPRLNSMGMESGIAQLQGRKDGAFEYVIYESVKDTQRESLSAVFQCDASATTPKRMLTFPRVSTMMLYPRPTTPSHTFGLGYIGADGVAKERVRATVDMHTNRWSADLSPAE